MYLISFPHISFTVYVWSFGEKPLLVESFDIRCGFKLEAVSIVGTRQ